MTLTIKEPTAYKLTLSCGHHQLTTYPLPVDAGYPCWVACNPDSPTPATVVNVAVYEPEENVCYVVGSGLNNQDMLNLQKVVALTNRESEYPLLRTLRRVGNYNITDPDFPTVMEEAKQLVVSELQNNSHPIAKELVKLASDQRTTVLSLTTIIDLYEQFLEGN